MNRRGRWLLVAAAVLFVGMVEALGDSALDAALPFPLHTLLAIGVMAAVVGTGAMYAFRQIDRLTADLRERNANLESRNAVLRAVYDVSLAVSSKADPNQTIASIVDHCRSLLRVDAALLAVNGPAGELRLHAASAGPGVLVGGEPGVGVMDTEEDDLGCFLRQGYQIRLSTPVGPGDQRVGMLGLAVAARNPRRFDQAEIETLSALATQVGLAIEADRLRTELEALAVQGERERIAREMHDGLAQVLAYVNTKSQAVEEMLAAGRPDEARRHLDELATAARSLYVDVREAILSLSAPVSDRGVAAALEEYAALYAESSKLAVRFRASPEATEAPLSAAAQAEIFSIAREALTNVRKHARAHRVGVDLTLVGSDLVLGIEDDGVGFEAELLAAGPERWPHFGLAGMRERAESVGGHIVWSSRLGAGTRVELRVPAGSASWSHLPLGVASSSETDNPGLRHQAVRSPASTRSEAD
jgi:signal transduction histidine kinase